TRRTRSCASSSRPPAPSRSRRPRRPPPRPPGNQGDRVKGASAAIKVGITALLVAVIGWAGFKFVGKGIQGDEGFEVWALFHDATGLVDKSRVQIAGLVIGELKERRLFYDEASHTTLARVTVRINL